MEPPHQIPAKFPTPLLRKLNSRPRVTPRLHKRRPRSSRHQVPLQRARRRKAVPAHNRAHRKLQIRRASTKRPRNSLRSRSGNGLRASWLRLIPPGIRMPYHFHRDRSTGSFSGVHSIPGHSGSMPLSLALTKRPTATRSGGRVCKGTQSDLGQHTRTTLRVISSGMLYFPLCFMKIHATSKRDRVVS